MMMGLVVMLMQDSGSPVCQVGGPEQGIDGRADAAARYAGQLTRGKKASLDPGRLAGVPGKRHPAKVPARGHLAARALPREPAGGPQEAGDAPLHTSPPCPPQCPPLPDAANGSRRSWHYALHPDPHTPTLLAGKCCPVAIWLDSSGEGPTMLTFRSCPG